MKITTMHAIKSGYYGRLSVSKNVAFPLAVVHLEIRDDLILNRELATIKLGSECLQKETQSLRDCHMLSTTHHYACQRYKGSLCICLSTRRNQSYARSLSSSNLYVCYESLHAAWPCPCIPLSWIRSDKVPRNTMMSKDTFRSAHCFKIVERTRIGPFQPTTRPSTTQKGVLG